jgi:hypothetical protein
MENEINGGVVIDQPTVVEQNTVVSIVETAPAVSTITPHVVRRGKNGLPEITLTDGRIARFTRKPKGRDSAIAMDQTAKKPNAMRNTAVLLSQIVEIDGMKVNWEQLLDLDLDDVAALAENMPGNF